MSNKKNQIAEKAGKTVLRAMIFHKRRGWKIVFKHGNGWKIWELYENWTWTTKEECERIIHDVIKNHPNDYVEG